jgi:hypothetical protein
MDHVGNQTVAVIGAGPYGLAVASHLLDAGVPTKIFGETMGFWRHNMPVGMLLRSEWPGSSIADPNRRFTLDRYETERGVTLPRRLPLEEFVAYGEWFQRQAVPAVDPRRVARVSPAADGYRLELEDGEHLEAGRVVVATGLASFTSHPPAFVTAPAELVIHSSELRDVARFADRRVVVVGAGQSALESAALLHEAGAEVEVVARAPFVRWLAGRSRLRRYSGPFRKLLYPPGEVGPLGVNWIVEYPDLFRRLPQDYQRRVIKVALRPAGSAWLRPRLEGVPITPGRTVVATTSAGQRLRLTLSDQTEREVDRVVLAIGYHVDIQRYPFLTPELAKAVDAVDGSPILAAGFESSVPGLHFVGAVAARSYGPLLRFVAGTRYTAREVAEGILRTRTVVIGSEKRLPSVQT